MYLFYKGAGNQYNSLQIGYTPSYIDRIVFCPGLHHIDHDTIQQSLKYKVLIHLMKKMEIFWIEKANCYNDISDTFDIKANIAHIINVR